MPPVTRTEAGRFVKGFSGNPSGRPSPQNAEVKEVLKAASVDAAKKLVELLKSKQDKIALQAAQEILNRTEGKPRESVSMDLSGGLDVRAQVRRVLLEHLSGGSVSDSDDGHRDEVAS